ncbi:hypothetical protein HDU87_003649 [Geranomyces variabilis]|uniref:NADH dehydrogenase [ubiquinone] 1 alpha subcomplex subunit n=1 Tax=Geranomyces variabilis TaxID=109894 RepID=A0AAD5TPP3_9FUNG|nr:hypothetical protein HDU87_003649 [Geranomyces variabilis]
MFRRAINALKATNLPWRSHRLVGRDLDGNMYFEGPATRAGTDRTRRTIEYYDGRTEFYQYDPNAIPPQWQSWLRHCRDDAPSVAELQRAEQQRVLTVQRARELDRKWEERKVEIEREKMASLPSAAEQLAPQNRSPPHTPTATPSGHGDAFEPGSWAPASKRPPPSSAPPAQAPATAPKGQGDTFEPGAWRPASKRR